MMMKLSKSVALYASSVFCCSLLASNTVVAQCESWESYPDGVAKAQEQHVLYRDLFKANKFDEAFPYWEKVFQYVKAPKEAPSRHFSDGIKMYQEKMKKETDAAKKAEMLKKMVELYDQQAKCTGEKSVDRAYQGYYMYFFEGDYKTTLKVLERAMELGGNDVHNVVFTPVAEIASYLFQSKDPDITAEYMIKLHDKLKAITDHQTKNATADAEKYKDKWAKVVAIYEPIGGKLWGCDFYVNKWKPIQEKSPNDLDIAKQIIEELKSKCAKDDPFFAKVVAFYEPEQKRLDSINFWVNEYPKLTKFQQAEANSKWGKKAEKAGRQAEADKYYEVADALYEEVVRGTPDPSMTPEDQGTLAYKVAYKEYKKGNFSEARSLCRKASEYRPKWGEPYMLIGYMYAASGSRCDPSGKGTGWDAQVVVWAAMDEWARAKSIDPEVADDANRLIGKYKQYCPTVGEGFQRGFKNGDSYKIGCWIGVTTTVRLSEGN